MGFEDLGVELFCLGLCFDGLEVPEKGSEMGLRGSHLQHSQAEKEMGVFFKIGRAHV